MLSLYSFFSLNSASLMFPGILDIKKFEFGTVISFLILFYKLKIIFLGLNIYILNKIYKYLHRRFLTINEPHY